MNKDSEFLIEIVKELNKYQDDINNIKTDKKIDCITIFSKSVEEYEYLNEKLCENKIIDIMDSGKLYCLKNAINTPYGNLSFIKIRKHDDNYNRYRISVDFTVESYEEFKNSINNPVVKKYDTFELVQLKNETSIINIVSIGAKEDYKI